MERSPASPTARYSLRVTYTSPNGVSTVRVLVRMCGRATPSAPITSTDCSAAQRVASMCDWNSPWMNALTPSSRVGARSQLIVAPIASGAL